MAHDASKVLLGTIQTSSKEITEHLGSPATYKAGLAIRLKNNAGVQDLSLLKADGLWLGISLGKGLSDSLKTVAIARDGLKVPILLELSPARLVVTITNFGNLTATSNDTLQFQHTGLSLNKTLTFKTSASTEDEVDAVTSNTQTATNLAAKINAHSVLGTIFNAKSSGAVVTIVAKDRTLLGTDFTVTYTSNGSVGLTLDASTFTGGNSAAPDYVTIGSKVYISDSSGKADDSNEVTTISDATYVSGVLSGIQEDGTEAACALVDMPGGL
jgi:hypothetical protein